MTSPSLRRLYKKLGERYPEEKWVYRTPSGWLRYRFVQNLVGKYVVRRKTGEGAIHPHADIGCGGGMYLNAGDIGVDISLATLVRAKLKQPDFLFVVGDAENLGFIEENRLASLLCTETIEHLENPILFIRGAYNALASGGVLIITCPNWRKTRPYLTEAGILEEFGCTENYIHTAYRPEELATLTSDAGFETIDYGTFEKELRFWLRPLNIIYKLLSPFGKLFAFRAKNTTAWVIFSLFRLMGITHLMRHFIKEGNRSYIVVRKV